MAVKCMEQYISQQKISEADKEKMKQNHKQWLRRLFRALSNDSMNMEKWNKLYTLLPEFSNSITIHKLGSVIVL